MKAHVVKEQRATFSAAPGTEALRPPAATSLPNVFLAGDFTRTGWPATMEGAVRGGYLAAEAVARAAGRPARFLLPDTRLSYWAAFLTSLISNSLGHSLPVTKRRPVARVIGDPIQHIGLAADIKAIGRGQPAMTIQPVTLPVAGSIRAMRLVCQMLA